MSATTLSGLARTAEPLTMLRRFLVLDAVVTGVNGLAYVAASGPLGRLLGVDPTLLLWLGVFLLAFAADVGWLASRREPSAFLTRLVIDVNAVWVVASIAALALWLTPTTVGAVWGLMQAATVGGFAALQFGALRLRR
ncbi:hypothetical protein F0344_21050 [Streptomyces finlayi]|uniref:Integral membrane protein n=1 Tax=Streptomyces finlayi TaxID=67296 RepID=A0A7G7BN64_9ACTN|nr:hypothetical protein [Streptomyces finlayi]QNE76779.1 hypothetical protein F0344_21050 [Streptomyces finlayi]